MENRLSEKLNIRSTNINVLKFVCAILVILCHSYPITGNGTDILSRATGGEVNFGGLAVSVFFFYSGLYVAKSMNRAGSIRSFLWKRIVRLFPQLCLVVLASAFVLGPIMSILSPAQYFTNPGTYRYLLNGILIPVHDLPGVFTDLPYSTVNGPLWTMPVEFLCYIALALVTALALLFSGKEKRPAVRGEAVNSKATKVLLLLGWTLCFGLFLYIRLSQRGSTLFEAVRPTILFLEGGMIYIFRDRIRLIPWLGFLCAALLAVLAPTGFFSFGMIFLLPYALLALPLGLPQLPVRGKLFSLSYEMYLLGWPVQQVLLSAAGGRMNPLVNTVLTVPVDLLLAFLLNFAVERAERRHA